MQVGAILTGGQSRRMGRTKALIAVDGVPMAHRAEAALLDGGCHDVVLIGGDPDVLAPLGIPVIEDLFPGQGPIGGVITALTHHARCHPGDDVVIVACDVPYLDDASIAALVAAAAATPCDVVVATADRLEPMCALWRAQTLPTIRSMFDGGQRALHRVVAALDHIVVEVPSDVVRNMNSPDDLPPA